MVNSKRTLDSKSILYTFDLKGSTVNRMTKVKNKDDKPVLKDENLE